MGAELPEADGPAPRRATQLRAALSTAFFNASKAFEQHFQCGLALGPHGLHFFTAHHVHR